MIGRMKRALFAISLLAMPALAQPPSKDILAWAPKATKPTAWTGPHKPRHNYAEMLARHKGQANWNELVVDDEHLRSEFISAAPGTKTPRRFHPDTREWWVVTDGQIRFSIEGQQPFVASKGMLVQVPYRTIYSMETVGATPSVRFETNIAKATTLYPMDEKPPALEGFNFIPVRITGPVMKDFPTNRIHATYEELAAEAEATPRKQATLRFAHDERATVNFIYGYAKDLPAVTDADLGHYHSVGAEFWIVLGGHIQYKIEGIDTFVAEPFDVVYVPKSKWHRARWFGDGPSTRLAMNGYFDIGHLFEVAPPK
jgi:mannose-6-phosphate isomerase-like protein (cupin superfamily)